jgi:hypothetical protein
LCICWSIGIFAPVLVSITEKNLATLHSARAKQLYYACSLSPLLHVRGHPSIACDMSCKNWMQTASATFRKKTFLLFPMVSNAFEKNV